MKIRDEFGNVIGELVPDYESGCITAVALVCLVALFSPIVFLFMSIRAFLGGEPGLGLVYLILAVIMYFVVAIVIGLGFGLSPEVTASIAVAVIGKAFMWLFQASAVLLRVLWELLVAVVKNWWQGLLESLGLREEVTPEPTPAEPTPEPILLPTQVPMVEPEGEIPEVEHTPLPQTPTQIPSQVGSGTKVVFWDSNGNGVFDADENDSGVRILLWTGGGTPPGVHDCTTHKVTIAAPEDFDWSDIGWTNGGPCSPAAEIGIWR